MLVYKDCFKKIILFYSYEFKRPCGCCACSRKRHTNEVSPSQSSSAIKKYADEGKKSYVNCFTGTIGENTSLESQRMSIIDEYIRLRVRYALIYHTDIKFLRLNGFFPQATQVDNWKAFVPVDLEKIETEIKARINNKSEYLK